MKLEAVAGLWTTGRLAAAAPLLAALELEGAVLSWAIDQPSTAPDLTFTDVRRADWLYRLVGDNGHVAVLSAVAAEHPSTGAAFDLVGVQMIAGSLEPLHRLAVGHWLRRWWPASTRDGIATLDRALLDAEVALLTVDAQGFLSDELVDAEVAELLGPQASALLDHLHQGDPRAVGLVSAAVDVADDCGVAGPGWEDVYAARDQDIAVAAQQLVRDDFALAAGRAGVRTVVPIAAGTATVAWCAVPPHIFDAADNTVSWTVEQSGGDAIAVVSAALLGSGSPAGVEVRFTAGRIAGAGVFDARGAVVLSLSDGDSPLTEAALWGRDWSTAAVTIGAAAQDSPESRQRVRALARRRLATPGADAFLAEILAAEADY
ncbi:MAG: hypothetical protein ACSLE6_20625 [Mycobacterium sp.]